MTRRRAYYFISSPFEVTETGGGGGGGGVGGGGGGAYLRGGEGGLFNLENTMVLVLYKDLERGKSRKAHVQDRWRSYSRGSEANPNFQLVNKPSGISLHKV